MRLNLCRDDGSLWVLSLLLLLFGVVRLLFVGVLLDLMPLPGGVGEAAVASILNWSIVVIVLLLFSYITIVWVHDGIGNG